MSTSRCKIKIRNRYTLNGILVLLTLFVTMMITTVTSFAAVSNVNGGTSKDLQKAIDESKKGTSISISGTVIIDETVTINRNITLIGSGTLMRKNGFRGSIIKVDRHSEAIMKGITIDGNDVSFAKPAVYVDSGKFQMKSGTIKNNYDSGVFNHGTFKMYGGTISKNGDLDGGGVYNDYGTFEMRGGTISGNKALSRGCGVYNNTSATFKMIKGTISENKKSCHGGGVYNCGTFRMNGGTILDNKVSLEGGGVYNDRGVFEMTGGSISENKAICYGGGIYNCGGKVKINEGRTVLKNNSPEDKYGF